MTIKVRKKKENKNNSTDISLLVANDVSCEYQNFDKNKIIESLIKEVGIDEDIANNIANNVENKILKSDTKEISVSLVRELVDNELFLSGFNAKLKKHKTIGIPTFNLEELIFSKTNENSNLSSNNPEAINMAISENVMKQYALSNVFSEDIANAHLKGRIHLHDLGCITRNYCSSHSIDFIKKYGLELENLTTQSAPAKHASTLTGHINTFLSSIQTYYAGALGLANVNIAYAPYLVGMSYNEILQEAQYLIYSCAQNAFSRGGQSLKGDENIYVYNKYTKKIETPTIEEFYNTFSLENDKNKYSAISLNTKTGKSELNDIYYAIKHKRKNKLVNVRCANGVNCNVTEDHSLFSLDKNMQIKEAKPSENNKHFIGYDNIDSENLINNIDLLQYKTLDIIEIKDCESQDEYVYDISVKNNENFLMCCGLFAHNTLFIDFNIHTGIPEYMKNLPAIGKGGEYTGKTYSEYEKEAQLFAKALMEVWQKGDKNGQIFAFPKCLDKETFLTFYDKNENIFFTDTIQNIYINFKSGHDIYLPHPNGATKIVNFEYSGKEIGLEFILDNNIKIKCKNDHKFYIINNEDILLVKEAKDINKTENLVFVLKNTFYSNITNFTNLNKNINNIGISSEDFKNKLSKLKIQNIVTTEVDTYAIEVDSDDHTFITADGVLTKNCDFHINNETFDKKEQYDLLKFACQISSENGVPYFIFDRDAITLSACCRLRTTLNMADEYDKMMIERPESMRYCGFQNITINLPQAAYRAGKGNIKGVIDDIYESMDICIKAHFQKKEFISKLMQRKGLPLWQMGKKSPDGLPYIDLERASYIIGMVGLNECVQFLCGEQLHESDNAFKLGLQIISSMFLKINEYSKKYNLKFVLEESPAESATRRMAKIDLKQYPESKEYIKGDLDSDEFYYTNSIHFAAGIDMPIIERIQKQSKFHSLIAAGAIIHAFIGEENPSPESILNLVNKTWKNTNCAQLTVSPEFTICNSCHKMTRGIKNKCEHCGAENVAGIDKCISCK